MPPRALAPLCEPRGQNGQNGPRAEYTGLRRVQRRTGFPSRESTNKKKRRGRTGAARREGLGTVPCAVSQSSPSVILHRARLAARWLRHVPARETHKRQEHYSTVPVFVRRRDSVPPIILCAIHVVRPELLYCSRRTSGVPSRHPGGSCAFGGRFWGGARPEWALSTTSLTVYLSPEAGTPISLQRTERAMAPSHTRLPLA